MSERASERLRATCVPGSLAFKSWLCLLVLRFLGLPFMPGIVVPVVTLQFVNIALGRRRTKSVPKRRETIL